MENLDKRLEDARDDLNNLRAGSVTKARSVIKALRRSDRKQEAKQLVDLMNKKARDIAQKN